MVRGRFFHERAHLLRTSPRPGPSLLRVRVALGDFYSLSWFHRQPPVPPKLLDGEFYLYLRLIIPCCFESIYSRLYSPHELRQLGFTFVPRTKGIHFTISIGLRDPNITTYFFPVASFASLVCDATASPAFPRQEVETLPIF